MKHRTWYFLLVIPAGLAMVVQWILDPLGGLPWTITGLAALAVGSVLAWRVPSNPISWLFLIQGFSFGGAYVFLILLRSTVGLDSSQFAWGEAIFYAVSTASVMVLPIILLRFPDGRHQSRGWRLVEWAAIGAAVTGASASILNGGWGGDTSQAIAVSPLHDSTQPVGDVLSMIFFSLFATSFVAGAGSLILRYRRSTGESRLQIKFLAYAAWFFVVALVAIFIESGFSAVQTDTVWEAWLAALGFASIPLAIGLAVLRYRLYDIDVVISRTLVLAVLAGFITVTYAVIVVGVGQLVGGDGEGLLLPIGATAVVAVAFEPVRLRAQRWANRFVFGSRATPYEVLSDVTGRLATAQSGAGIVDRLAELLRDGTGADEAVVWLGEPGSMSVAASSPPGAERKSQPTLDEDTSFVVSHDGEPIGALEVRKARGSVLSSQERSLIADLAGSGGAVLGYQRLNDSLQAKAGELEQSRARLVGAQDQERRRLERELHEGAEQYIVALKVKLGVATQLASKTDATGLVTLLDGLTSEAQAALDDVQSLAKGIYPPVLESDGLGAAISALATASPVDIRLERDGIGRYPADIEAAVYFNVAEAVTNAVKHANPPITIELGESGGKLLFSVVDDGPGFDLDGLDKGSGLENMVDRLAAVGGRLEIESASGSQTRIHGEIPVI